MRVLQCTRCGLAYGSAAIPQHLLSSEGASCPRCGAPLAEAGGTRTFRARPATERHRIAVERSLRWADEAAEQGDFASAVSWLATVEAVDGEIPSDYHERRVDWAARLTAARAQREPAGEVTYARAAGAAAAAPADRPRRAPAP